MRAALITGREQLEFRDFPLPEPRPTTAVVAIARCGICGSDVAAFRTGYRYKPFLSGHEWTGTVLSIGNEVDSPLPGDRVVLGAPPACGRCALCRAGVPDRCEHILALATGVNPLTPPHGGYAERVAVPSESLLNVPDAISDDRAAMIEPATVALHAVRRRPPQVGGSAVLIGAGPVGLFAVQLLRISGAARVLVVEPRARRRALAIELGADGAVPPEEARELVDEATGGVGADVVYDCAGTGKALMTAADLCRPGGSIMMVGVETTTVELAPAVWLRKELTLDTSLGCLNHEFAMTIDLMATGRLRAKPLHDLTVGLDGLGRMLAELATGQDYVKVLVDPHA